MFAWAPDDLNPEQEAAIEEPGSVFLVACPGSGKTRTLTYKIARLLSPSTDQSRLIAYSRRRSTVP